MGADKRDDTEEFIQRCRRRRVTPHVAQQTTKRASRVGRVGWTFVFTAAAYNLVRRRALLAASG